MAWSPDGDDEPYVYERGMMLVYLPNGEIRRGTDVISPATAEAIEVEPVHDDDLDDEEAA